MTGLKGEAQVSAPAPPPAPPAAVAQVGGRRVVVVVVRARAGDGGRRPGAGPRGRAHLLEEAAAAGVEAGEVLDDSRIFLVCCGSEPLKRNPTADNMHATWLDEGTPSAETAEVERFYVEPRLCLVRCHITISKKQMFV